MFCLCVTSRLIHPEMYVLLRQISRSVGKAMTMSNG